MTSRGFQDQDICVNMSNLELRMHGIYHSRLAILNKSLDLTVFSTIYGKYINIRFKFNARFKFRCRKREIKSAVLLSMISLKQKAHTFLHRGKAIHLNEIFLLHVER